jgi:flagellar protein FlaJ
MEFHKGHLIGLATGVMVLLSSLLFMGTPYMFFLAGMGVLIGSFPFVFSLIRENQVANEKEEMFLEFARNLVESVKTGTPVSKSIINVKGKPYGVLSENVEKLANQIQMGIPMGHALQTFAKDVDNKTVSRALTLIGQAEKEGGNIGEILESVAGAVNLSDKLKKERKAGISTLVVQGYIIFLVFLMIVLVMQFKIIPLISGIAGIGEATGVGVSGGGGGEISVEEVSGAFLYLLLIQGFFSGITIGKLSEGSLKAGIKHSFALMVISFMVSAGANVIFG